MLHEDRVSRLLLQRDCPGLVQQEAEPVPHLLPRSHHRLRHRLALHLHEGTPHPILSSIEPLEAGPRNIQRKRRPDPHQLHPGDVFHHQDLHTLHLLWLGHQGTLSIHLPSQFVLLYIYIILLRLLHQLTDKLHATVFS